MKGTIAKVSTLIIALMIVSAVLVGTGAEIAFARDTVTICHSTGSTSNPYVTQNPAANGDVSGHDGHDGGIFPADPWGDIIPPFEFEGGSYPGKNWTTEGQAIYNNGCAIPEPPTPTPTDVPPTATPTDVPPTATPTEVPAELSIQVSMGRPSCGVISFIITGNSSVPGTVNIWLNGSLYGQSPYDVDGDFELKFFNVPVPDGNQTVKATLSAGGSEVSHTNNIDSIPCPETPTPTPPPEPTPTTQGCELVPQYVMWKLWDSSAGVEYSGVCYVISSDAPSVDRAEKICTLCGDLLDESEESYRWRTDRWRRGTVYLNECTGEYVFIFDSGTTDDEWRSVYYRPDLKDNIRTTPRLDCKDGDC